MRTLKNLKNIYVFAVILLVGYACNNDDDATPDPTPESIYETAASDPNNSYSIFIEAVDIVNLNKELDGTGITNKDYTVFIPNDDAFNTLLTELKLQNISEVDETLLDSILKLHIVEAVVLSGDLTDGMEVETLNGEMLTVNVDGDTVTLTDANGSVSTITNKNIKASNGIIHVLDAVLQPM